MTFIPTSTVGNSDHRSPSLTLAPRLHSVSMTTEYHPMMMGCYSKVAQTMEQTEDYSCTCTHRWTTVLVYVQLFPSMCHEHWWG